MKILIWSDLHAHPYQEFSTFVEDKSVYKSGVVNSRLLDIIKVIREIRVSAKRNNVELVVFGGDLYQAKNNVDSLVIRLITAELVELAVEFPLVMVSGNHDYRLWGIEPALLQLLTDIDATESVVLYEKECWNTFRSGEDNHRYEGDGQNFYIVPYSRKLSGLNERIEALETDPKQDIFLGHQDMLGTHYGGFEVTRGLDPDVLSKKFRWSFIGHNHDPFKLNGNVVSVGAPLQHNFGDKLSQRGWWLLDTVADKVEFIENTFSPSFQDKTVKKGEAVGFEDSKNFYRIKVLDSKAPEGLNRIRWKQVSYETSTEKKSRSSLRMGDTKEDIVKKYVEAQAGILNKGRLIELGRRFL